jgi:hypothetical protein
MNNRDQSFLLFSGETGGDPNKILVIMPGSAIMLQHDALKLLQNSLV